MTFWRELTEIGFGNWKMENFRLFILILIWTGASKGRVKINFVKVKNTVFLEFQKNLILKNFEKKK